MTIQILFRRLALICVASVMIMLAACSGGPKSDTDKTDKAAKEADAAIPVEIARAARRPMSASYSATASLRSEEHTSELQSLMRTSYAVFCLKKKNTRTHTNLRPSQNII